MTVAEALKIKPALKAQGEWNRLRDGTWGICVRLGGRGEQFVGRVCHVIRQDKTGSYEVLGECVQDFGPGDVAIFRPDEGATEMRYYAVVTFGTPRGVKVPSYTRSEVRARRAAQDCVGTGSCTNARVYECDTIELARTSDISEVRPGERIVAL